MEPQVVQLPEPPAIAISSPVSGDAVMLMLLKNLSTNVSAALGVGSAATSGVLGLAVLAVVLLALFVFLKKRKQGPKIIEKN